MQVDDAARNTDVSEMIHAKATRPTAYVGMRKDLRGAMPRSCPKPVILRLIDQMEAWSDRNESLLTSSRKARALLAILALAGGEPGARDAARRSCFWSSRGENDPRASDARAHRAWRRPALM